MKRGMFNTFLAGVASFMGFGNYNKKKETTIRPAKTSDGDPTRTVHVGKPTRGCTKTGTFFHLKKVKNRLRNKISRKSRRTTHLAMG